MAKAKGKKKGILILLDILIVACFLGALYFFLEPKIRSRRQLEVEQDAVKQINSQLKVVSEENNNSAEPLSQVTIAVDPDANKVPGEAYDNFGGEAIEEEYVYDEYGNIIIHYIGSLSIPDIELETPIANDDSLVAIRYGVGHTPESAKIGDPGRALLFGHWFQEYGRVFNRLEEIKEGDEFSIDILENRTRYHYKVHKAVAVTTEELYDRLFNDPVDVESEVVLVTCIVRNYAWWAPSGRYLVYGELIDSEKVD